MIVLSLSNDKYAAGKAGRRGHPIRDAGGYRSYLGLKQGKFT